MKYKEFLERTFCSIYGYDYYSIADERYIQKYNINKKGTESGDGEYE